MVLCDETDETIKMQSSINVTEGVQSQLFFLLLLSAFVALI